MSHPEISKSLCGEFADLWLADEQNRPVLTCLVQTTLMIETGGIRVPENQQAIVLGGETWGPPETSSIRYEPQFAFVKPCTDVVLHGHAHAKNKQEQQVDVGVKVGPVQKIVRVFGDRYWVKTGGRIHGTRPRPFERVPLLYERAFGGWDRADRDQSEWRYDRRNPVGRGFGDPLRYVEEGKVPMPNLEDPARPIGRYGDSPQPAGFGFIGPNWQPRSEYAGTYDEVWEKERKPLLPKDFDRRFFNAASPGLIAPGYLRGDEDVVIVNAAAIPQIKFRLPGFQPPVCTVALRGAGAETPSMNLDTVIIDTDRMLVLLLWRGHLTVPNGPHEVIGIDVSARTESHRLATA